MTKHSKLDSHKEKFGQDIKVGASIPEGVAGLKVFTKLKLGDMILTKLPMDKQEALAVARYCKEHRIYFIFSELLWRGTFDLCWAARRKIPRSEFYSKQDLEKIFRAGRGYFLGRITLGEVGGLLYWPKAYLYNRAAENYRNLPAVNNVAEAKQDYIEFIRRVIDFEKNNLGNSNLFDCDASMVFKYHLEAGIDVPSLEIMPGDCMFMTAALRGAARAYEHKIWGSHIAMACYGGVSLDEMWMKRWKIALYFCFMAGNHFVYSESGHFTYSQVGKFYAFESAEMKQVRRILREFNQFAKIHQRPPDGPKVKMGIVYGHLDGYPGLWNKYVWGQFRGSKWLHGPAEFGWDLVGSLYRKEEWDNENVQGRDDFRGNPPYGQFDIVPIEAPLKILAKYSCLVFLGWNTMTDEIYKKLKTYVRGGGHLVMSIPHLSRHIDRAQELSLYRNGDWRDLFGVCVKGPGKKGVAGIKTFNRSLLRSYKMPVWRIDTDPRFMGNLTIANSEVKGARVISGWSDFYHTDEKDLLQKPILTEYRLGKGVAFLIHSWTYPGDREGISAFVKNLLGIISDGEQGEIRITGSDRVRYAVYKGKVPNGKGGLNILTTIYLLNTEFEIPQPVHLWIRGKKCPALIIPPAEMCITYYSYSQNLILAPEDRGVQIQSWTSNLCKQQISLFTRSDQKIRIFNLLARKQIIGVNGRQVSCRPNDECAISVKKKADPERAQYFASNFLEEPRIKWKLGRLAY